MVMRGKGSFPNEEKKDTFSLTYCSRHLNPTNNIGIIHAVSRYQAFRVLLPPTVQQSFGESLFVGLKSHHDKLCAVKYFN